MYYLPRLDTLVSMNHENQGIYHKIFDHGKLELYGTTVWIFPKKFINFVNTIYNLTQLVYQFTCKQSISSWQVIVGLKQTVYFDIRIFFTFQTNSPNIFTYKSGKMILLSVNL